LLHGVAREFDAGTVKLEDLLAAKSTAVNNAIAITDKALRICGSHGLTADSPLHRYYLNVRAGLHNPPADDEILRLLAQVALA
ncbi:MAG TPA: acyl-CoA dehydrogenase family protein, partial [Metalysinibacillus sp.]